MLGPVNSPYSSLCYQRTRNVGCHKVGEARQMYSSQIDKYLKGSCYLIRECTASSITSIAWVDGISSHPTTSQPFQDYQKNLKNCRIRSSQDLSNTKTEYVSKVSSKFKDVCVALYHYCQHNTQLPTYKLILA